MSTLFSYNIEEIDGKLVITVSGAFADEALRVLREEMKSGRSFAVLSSLSPIKPLKRMMARQNVLSAAAVASPAAVVEPTGVGEKLDMDQIFNQGIDQSFAGFEQQMREFHESLDALKADLKVVDGSATE